MPTSRYYTASAAAVVTLRVNTDHAPSDASHPSRYAWDATLYVLDAPDAGGARADIVDAIPLSGTVTTRTTAVTPAMLVTSAQRHVREAVEDLTGRDHDNMPVTIKWSSIRTLEGYKGATLPTTTQRAAGAAWFWSVMGVEPEDLPRDRSLAAIGLVDLAVEPVR